MEINFLKIREIFGALKQSQVDGINTIVSEYKKYGNDKRHLAYVLATVFHETGRKMQPVKEFGSESYLRSKAYYPYYGRDLVQTTWKANYQKVKNFTGIDVVSNPELVGQMPLSATVAVIFMQKGWYTGKKLSNYFNETSSDPVNARRIINGLDKAQLIAGYYYQFFEAVI